ncbi:MULTISPECIES: ABC transporter ATP-binding protein [Enterococcaceae]|uniref:ABC transporter ATP-binding protein n=1 Tax=Enterococcaceae TaxID=81852 RepID=UPI000E530E50|nr:MULTISPECIES: ABC transporter ATP-binding protein [Enterococcaceae]RGI31894.1 ABC transporter ATP-binding protein [Melissococcus sp. OM08-11BH]UNM90356.1 ABC transporter ATP-binding protein [Vagococcus sp. CY52-2]
MSILKASKLNYYYQDGDTRRFILKNMNVSFEKGQFYSIVGQSGSGKTTFLSLLAGLDKPQGGRIFYEKKNIEKIGYDEYRRDYISIIFQHYNLIPYLTAVENVLVPMAITDNKLPENEEKVAMNLLDYMGISNDKAKRLVTQLSGGEQQRVAIARALATNVDVILADEPTGNLDEEMEQEIVEIFKMLAHKHNKCVIVVTHSPEIALQSDHSYLLRKGVLKENV